MQCPTNASAKPSTILTNTTVSTWVADTSQAGYSYHADISHPDITVDMPATVIFSVTDASSGNYAPICQTGTGYVRIYSKVNTSVTIPIVKIEGAINYYELQGTVGTDTKPIKIVNGQAVAVTNALAPLEDPLFTGTMHAKSRVNNANITAWTWLDDMGVYAKDTNASAEIRLIQFANNNVKYTGGELRVHGDASNEGVLGLRINESTGAMETYMGGTMNGTYSESAIASSSGNLTLKGDVLTLRDGDAQITRQADNTNAYTLMHIRHPTTRYYARLVLAINSSNVVGLSLQKLNPQGGWVSEQQIKSF